MTSTGNRLGHCPACDASITAGDVLIEYDAANGRRAYAECPACDTVVRTAGTG